MSKCSWYSQEKAFQSRSDRLAAAYCNQERICSTWFLFTGSEAIAKSWSKAHELWIDHSVVHVNTGVCLKTRISEASVFHTFWLYYLCCFNQFWDAVWPPYLISVIVLPFIKNSRVLWSSSMLEPGDMKWGSKTVPSKLSKRRTWERWDAYIEGSKAHEPHRVSMNGGGYQTGVAPVILRQKNEKWWSLWSCSARVMANPIFYFIAHCIL